MGNLPPIPTPISVEPLLRLANMADLYHISEAYLEYVQRVEAVGVDTVLVEPRAESRRDQPQKENDPPSAARKRSARMNQGSEDVAENVAYEPDPHNERGGLHTTVRPPLISRVN